MFTVRSDLYTNFLLQYIGGRIVLFHIYISTIVTLHHRKVYFYIIAVLLGEQENKQKNFLKSKIKNFVPQ